MRAVVFRVALRTRFRGVTAREGVLLHGPGGWAECSPFAEYGRDLVARWVDAAREAASTGWPPPLRDRVPVNTTVPAVGPSTAAALVRASGCTTAKVKVGEPGQTEADDLARVEAVRDALGPHGAIRVDANAAWDVDTAVRVLRRLAAFRLEYAEQPVATLAEMAALRLRVDVPLAADESVRLAPDPLHVPGLREAADLVVLKVQPLGGVRAALAIAEASRLPCVVSSALETSVGLAGGVALAAALPELSFACGLGTAPLLSADLVTDPLLPVDGELEVRRPEPDPDLLAAAALHGDEAEAWLRRLGDAGLGLDGAGWVP